MSDTKHIPLNNKALYRILRYADKNPSSLCLDDPDLYNDEVDELVPDHNDTDEICRRYNTHPALLEALEEAEAALKVSVGVIEKYAPEVDWKASTPRKGLEIVQSALATARA